MSTLSLLDYQSLFLNGLIDKPLRNHRFSPHPHILLQSNHRWLRNAGKCVDGLNESWTWTNVSPPSSRAMGVALKHVTVMNISVVPTSHALCWLFVSQANAKDEEVHALNSANEHTCMHVYECMFPLWMRLWAGGQFKGLPSPGWCLFLNQGLLRWKWRVRSTAWHGAVAWMTQIRDWRLAVLCLGGCM